MLEKQFEIGGVTFGLGAPIGMVDGGFTPGTPSIRSTDVDKPAANGRRFGRQFKGQTTWGFDLFVDADSEDEAWEILSALAGAWGVLEDERGVVESGEITALRYRLAGKERVVYGRPTLFTPTVDNLSMSGRINVTADFELVAPLYLSATEEFITLPILPPLNTSVGLVVPFDVPFISTAGSSQVQSQISIHGERSTPVRVTFRAGTGPLGDAVAIVGGKTIALTSDVQMNDPVIADARPWVSAISTASGGAVEVNPRVTRVSEFWLPPGDHQVIFTGTDPTSTASIEVRWQDAYRTLR